MNHPTAPIVRTESVFDRTGHHTITLVVVCPFCDSEHRHAAGSTIMHAHRHLGHLRAECGRREYDVVDSNALLPVQVAA